MESTQATVTVTGCEEFANGRLFVTTGSRGSDNDDSRGKLGQVTFTGAGTYTITFNTTYTKLTEGNTVQAYLYKYDSDTDKTIYRYSESAVITAADESGEKTPEEILKNTTATLMKNGEVRTENFKQSETSVDVKVTLDSSLKQCYMTIFAYSSNTTFDPDGSYNKRLWTGYVQNGQTVTCTFNQELPLYCNVIACLNVPVGEDFYKPSNSQALEVVDASGEGFRDYTYPDASIVETTLEPGATSSAITLRWNAPADEDNRPAAKAMTVSLYEGSRLIKEQTADAAAGSMTLTSLSANTAYTLRIAAVSPVGRSDTQVLGVSTAKRSSGGSSSSGPSGSSYAVSVPSAKNGDVTVSPKNASKGDRVTVTVTPDKGYELDTITVKDTSGNTVKLIDKGNGKYTFTMPASKVTVSAEFMEAQMATFADVPSDAYYAEAVEWAVDRGITNGKANGLFGSNDSCTRGQIVTFLWRAAGSPAPKGAAAVPTDVIPGSYCYNAVAWALENGITNGMADGTFGVNNTCTRGQSVTFLHRALGTAPSAVNGFTDVAADSFCADAVAWAVENGVTNGTSATTFSPNNGCTRAQIVTFLYRCLK